MKKVLILGTGCMKCNKLYEMVQKACEETNGDFKVEKVTDMNKIIEYGVVLTPALVIDGEVKLTGKIPASVDEIKSLLQ